MRNKNTLEFHLRMNKYECLFKVTVVSNVAKQEWKRGKKNK